MKSGLCVLCSRQTESRGCPCDDLEGYDVVQHWSRDVCGSVGVGSVTGVLIDESIEILNAFLLDGSIDLKIWAHHFDVREDGGVPVCVECKSYQNGTCAGNIGVLTCMIKKTANNNHGR